MAVSAVKSSFFKGQGEGVCEPRCVVTGCCHLCRVRRRQEQIEVNSATSLLPLPPHSPTQSTGSQTSALDRSQSKGTLLAACQHSMLGCVQCLCLFVAGVRQLSTPCWVLPAVGTDLFMRPYIQQHNGIAIGTGCKPKLVFRFDNSGHSCSGCF